MHVPRDWSYSISNITRRGYVQLAAGQVGSQTVTYYFSGSSAQARVSTPLRGPVAKDYLIADRLGISEMIWSACNSSIPLNVKTDVAITGNMRVNGQLTTDSIDGKVTTILGLQWKRCP